MADRLKADEEECLFRSKVLTVALERHCVELVTSEGELDAFGEALLFLTRFEKH